MEVSILFVKSFDVTRQLSFLVAISLLAYHWCLKVHFYFTCMIDSKPFLLYQLCLTIPSSVKLLCKVPASTGNFTVCILAQSCLTFCNPVNCSPPGSSVHGIFLARILEWVAISFSNSETGSSQLRDWTHIPFILRRILTFESPGKPHSIHLIHVFVCVSEHAPKGGPGVEEGLQLLLYRLGLGFNEGLLDWIVPS